MSLKALRGLSDWELRELGTALRSGRLCPPFSPIAVGRFSSPGLAETLAGDLAQLETAGMTAHQMALLAETLLDDRKTRYEPPPELCELVWTGPEAQGAAERDTSVVVRELFNSAQESVLVVGYVVFQAKSIFKSLSDRMEAQPDLSVKLFLNVPRGRGDTSLDSEILWRFSSHFKANEWPGKRLPEIYYDPRALAPDSNKRSSLHAKCVVVDKKIAFISSANFTEAAQRRNIEVGVMIRLPPLAQQLARSFEALAEAGILKAVPGFEAV